MPKVFALGPAAGRAIRIGVAFRKNSLPFGGGRMMSNSMEAIAAVSRVERLFVVLSPLDRHWGEHDWSTLPEKIEATFCGGAHRAESVLNTLKFLEGRVARDDWVLVHDAARPCILTELVEQFLDEVGDDQVGGLLAVPLADTLKRADELQRVSETIPRTGLWRAQTPQMFRYGMLRAGLEKKPKATDEAEAEESTR